MGLSAADPEDRLFRRMIAFSVGVHAAALLLGAGFSALSRPSLRIQPVAVVDLVPAWPPPGTRQAAPSAAGSPGRKAPPPRSAPERKAAKPPAPRWPSAKPPAREKAVPPKDGSREVSEKIRRMREEKEEADQVRRALDALRREREVKAAVGEIEKRKARRLDYTDLRSEGRGPSTVAVSGPPGKPGRTAVPPEQAAYFLELYGKVRSCWSFPELLRRDARGLVALVVITIEKDGRVSDVKMGQSSGNRKFDASVLEAIRSASPLPIPPARLRSGEDRYEVGFRFSWSEEDGTS